MGYFAISLVNRVWLFNWTKTPNLLTALCQFDWNWPSGSMEDFEISSIILLFCYHLSFSMNNTCMVSNICIIFVDLGGKNLNSHQNNGIIFFSNEKDALNLNEEIIKVGSSSFWKKKRGEGVRGYKFCQSSFSGCKSLVGGEICI